MKRLLIITVLLLSACSKDPATVNRDVLGTSQSLQVAAQTRVIEYRERPPCSAVLTTGCRNNLVYAEMRRLNHVATEANNEAFKKLSAEPNTSSTKLAVDAAIAAIRAFDDYAKDK